MRSEGQQRTSTGRLARQCLGLAVFTAGLGLGLGHLWTALPTGMVGF